MTINYVNKKSDTISIKKFKYYEDLMVLLGIGFIHYKYLIKFVIKILGSLLFYK